MSINVRPSSRETDGFNRALALISAYDRSLRSGTTAGPCLFEEHVRSTAAAGMQPLVDALSGLTMIASVTLGRLAQAGGMSLQEALHYVSRFPAEENLAPGADGPVDPFIRDDGENDSLGRPPAR